MTDMLTWLACFNQADDPTDEEMNQHWNGDGHIEFFVHQNFEDTSKTWGVFEIEILDSSGCAGGLEETLGLEYSIMNDILSVERSELRQGVTYTIKGLNVSWYKGDWSRGEDDDVEYNFTEMTSSWKLIPLIIHTIKMFWWQRIKWLFI